MIPDYSVINPPLSTLTNAPMISMMKSTKLTSPGVTSIVLSYELIATLRCFAVPPLFTTYH